MKRMGLTCWQGLHGPDDGVARYPHLIIALWLQGHFTGLTLDARSFDQGPISTAF
jgi:hypothetical protein